MPSPFPGMDPYLEGSEWMSIPIELSSEIARQLAPQLRPKYIARTMRRFVIDTPEDVAIVSKNIYPDVGILDSGHKGILGEGTVAVTPAPLQLITVMPVQVPDVSIEIYDVADRSLVTAIEVLSPANKRGEGYKEYLKKRQQLLYSTTHLLEIDLLRRGQRVPMKEALPPAPYFIFLSRAEQRPVIDVWPIQLQMPLPVIPIPLLQEDPDVILDLQTALNGVYDALSYDLAIDYTRQPEVPLNTKEAKWAQEHLAKRTP